MDFRNLHIDTLTISNILSVWKLNYVKIVEKSLLKILVIVKNIGLGKSFVLFNAQVQHLRKARSLLIRVFLDPMVLKVQRIKVVEVSRMDILESLFQEQGNIVLNIELLWKSFLIDHFFQMSTFTILTAISKIIGLKICNLLMLENIQEYIQLNDGTINQFHLEKILNKAF